METQETECLRQEILEELGDDWTPEVFRPGTFGCHEALHMASVLMGAVDRDLLGHPAIAVKPEWFALAAQAHRALFRLYQEIGAAHLDGCGPSGAQEAASAGQ